MVDTANITLWGHEVAAIAWEGSATTGSASFEYDPKFVRQGVEIAPLTMPLRDNHVYAFPRGRMANGDLDTFKGLPGLLADCLPDKFGHAVINAWLARQGRDQDSFTPLERLLYIGTRAMGALEFQPAVDGRLATSRPVDIASMVDLAHQVISKHSAFTTRMDDNADHTQAMLDILTIGTSAGGARPKAVIAVNDAGDVISGQADVPEGYSHWLIKFDGAGDIELGDTQGFGRVEYAYALMARQAGIDMAPCRLLEEGGRAHFMTKRFDRQGNRKLHMQTLCGVAHYDYNLPGAYGYEQAFQVMRQLKLSKKEAAQMYRRMVFNVVARNQDDHTKNISFLMDRDGRWRLSPAYDVTYAHNPKGQWTNEHQMTINGKRSGFTLQDLITVGESISLPRPKEIIDEVVEVVSQWPTFARQVDIKTAWIEEIGSHHRLRLGME